MIGSEIIEFKPNPKLDNIIYSYYLIQNNIIAHANIPPLGHPVVQFHIKNNINTFFSNYDFPIEEIMIVGQLTKFAKVNNVELASMIGVNFKPTALFKLTNNSMNIFTDKGVPASQCFDNDIYELLGVLRTGIDNEKKIALIDNYFIKLLIDKPILYDGFDILIDTIVDAKGKITKEKIDEIFPVSVRTRQRYFLERVGISLKTYLRVIRNLNFFTILQGNPDKTIQEIIFEVGYYDYCHFIKDFKLMTGMTPQKYFSNREDFSKLFIKP